MSPFVVGVCGGSASGKTTFCKKLIQMSNRASASFDTTDVSASHVTIKCMILSMDCYYKDKTPEDLNMANNSGYDFDHPNALYLDKFCTDINNIKKGGVVDVYEYDYSTHTTSTDIFTRYDGSEIDVLFVEGIHIFQHQELFDMKIFVDVDSDERLCRRIERDTHTRGRTLTSVLLEWRKFVKANFDNIIFPTKRFADVIVPHGADNNVCVEMVVTHLKNRLKK